MRFTVPAGTCVQWVDPEGNIVLIVDPASGTTPTEPCRPVPPATITGGRWDPAVIDSTPLKQLLTHLDALGLIVDQTVWAS